VKKCGVSPDKRQNTASGHKSSRLFKKMQIFLSESAPNFRDALQHVPWRGKKISIMLVNRTGQAN